MTNNIGAVEDCQHVFVAVKALEQLFKKCVVCEKRKKWPWTRLTKCSLCKHVWHRKCAPCHLSSDIVADTRVVESGAVDVSCSARSVNDDNTSHAVPVELDSTGRKSGREGREDRSQYDGLVVATAASSPDPSATSTQQKKPPRGEWSGKNGQLYRHKTTLESIVISDELDLAREEATLNVCGSTVSEPPVRMLRDELAFPIAASDPGLSAASKRQKKPSRGECGGKSRQLYRHKTTLDSIVTRSELDQVKEEEIEKNVRGPTVTQPTVTKPTITQPTVTQPTVTRPTVHEVCHESGQRTGRSQYDGIAVPTATRGPDPNAASKQQEKPPQARRGIKYNMSYRHKATLEYSIVTRVQLDIAREEAIEKNLYEPTVTGPTVPEVCHESGQRTGQSQCDGLAVPTATRGPNAKGPKVAPKRQKKRGGRGGKGKPSYCNKLLWDDSW